MALSAGDTMTTATAMTAALSTLTSRDLRSTGRSRGAGRGRARVTAGLLPRPATLRGAAEGTKVKRSSLVLHRHCFWLTIGLKHF
jgi:hypothetical protein